MTFNFDKNTSTLIATVSREEQIDLNDADLPIETSGAMRGRKLKEQLYAERIRILRDWTKPVAVRVILER